MEMTSDEKGLIKLLREEWQVREYSLTKGSEYKLWIPSGVFETLLESTNYDVERAKEVLRFVQDNLGYCVTKFSPIINSKDCEVKASATCRSLCRALYFISEYVETFPNVGYAEVEDYFFEQELPDLKTFDGESVLNYALSR
jgi:hypothetical protein